MTYCQIRFSQNSVKEKETTLFSFGLQLTKSFRLGKTREEFEELQYELAA